MAGISPKALGLLMRHRFPGNVREIENIIEHAFVMCRSGLIQPAHQPTDLHGRALPEGPSPLAAAERETLRRALDRHPNDRTAAAEALGLHRSTLWLKLKRHGL